MGAGLLEDFFKLLAGDASVETVDGDVKPVALFAFHDEIRQALCVRRVMPGLRDEINQQTPLLVCPTLAQRTEIFTSRVICFTVSAIQY